MPDEHTPENPAPTLAVPGGRGARLARLGWMATGIAGGMVAEGARRLAQGQRPAMKDLLLTPANARRMADQLAKLRGAAMKVGQLVSMESADLLPPALAEILGRTDRKFNRMRPSMARVLGLETRSAKEG